MKSFDGFRTSEPVSGDENYKSIGALTFENGKATFDFPAKSVTTFLAQ